MEKPKFEWIKAEKVFAYPWYVSRVFVCRQNPKKLRVYINYPGSPLVILEADHYKKLMAAETFLQQLGLKPTFKAAPSLEQLINTLQNLAELLKKTSYNINQNLEELKLLTNILSIQLRRLGWFSTQPPK